MSKLEAMLPGMYAEMHARSAFKGDSWNRHFFELFRFFDIDNNLGKHTILDYGCGPTGGLAGPRVTEYGSGISDVLSCYSCKVVPYDPYVEKYSADPWHSPLTGFFSCDVFEHMPLPQLRELLRRLCKHSSITHVFIALSTRAANKVLPNGLNAHITQHSGDWWQGLFDGILGAHFDCQASRVYLQEGEAAYEFVRRVERAPLPSDGRSVQG